MVEPLRHRQTKEAATDMFSLRPPRHISTLPTASDIAVQANVSFQVNCGSRWRVLERSKMTGIRHRVADFAVTHNATSDVVR
jgi:hypothetical protein